jgi:hypothetical protein
MEVGRRSGRDDRGDGAVDAARGVVREGGKRAEIFVRIADGWAEAGGAVGQLHDGTPGWVGSVEVSRWRRGGSGLRTLNRAIGLPVVRASSVSSSSPS